jgi:hypothetical protein
MDVFHMFSYLNGQVWYTVIPQFRRALPEFQSSSDFSGMIPVDFDG